MEDSTPTHVEAFNQPVDVKLEGENAIDPPATFDGKLNLSGFAFSPPRTRGRPQRTRENGAIPILPSKKRQPSNLSSTSSSPSKRARSGNPASYAPPSTYAHLSELPDTMAPNLILLLIGLNPGIETARSGNPYAHPSNLFWKLLHSSGLTPRRYLPSEHKKMPLELSLGNTNIVSRPTKNGAELSRQEMDDSVAALEEKIAKNRPEAVCIVGKSIWESIWRTRRGKNMKKADFKYGWQDAGENMGKAEGWEGAKVFVATSTSGLAASMTLVEKETIWNELGAWVQERRKAREAVLSSK